MLNKYAIKDRSKHGWFASRHIVEDSPEPEPVTVYVRRPDDAMQFRSLKEAKRFQRLLQAESKAPHRIQIIGRNWEVVC